MNLKKYFCETIKLFNNSSNREKEEYSRLETDESVPVLVKSNEKSDESKQEIFK